MPCAFYAERPSPFQELGPGCQFGGHEHDLINVDGVKLCPFHAPIENSDGNKTKKGFWDARQLREFYERVHVRIDTAKDNDDTCDLTGVVFPGVADFSEKEFPTVCFFVAKFDGIANFFGARFSGGDVNFDGARFSGGTTNFYKAKFSGGGASFVEARFGGNVTTFLEAGFSGGPARFIRAEFIVGSVIFSETQFTGGDAYFHGAQFSCGYSGFEKAKFSGFADFSAPGGENKEDSDKRIFREVHFGGARFEGKSKGNNNYGVTFENRRFLQQASFEDCFFASAPRFHGCELHPDTEFSGAEFPDTKSDGSDRAYRTLKLAMESVRSRNEEAMFYALEQKSLRHRSDTRQSAKIVSYLYEIMSDYGRDFILPIFWLLFVSFVFSQFYGDLAGAVGTECLQKMGNVGFAVQQIFRPFEIWKLATNGVSCGLGIKLIGTVQSLATLSLFALFLLALRRRFKMD